MEKLKKAVAYARFSTDMQRDESIDAQVRAIKYYAAQYGYEIIAIYADKAKTGRSADRPQFLQMIADSALGSFEAVIVHKLDRFSRDSTDTALYERELNRNGVELISVNEKLDKTPEGLLMKQIIVGMNQFYSANLAREVMKGLKENAYNCKHTGGMAPLGYDVAEDKRYIINPKEAEAVRMIFNMYIEGYGYSEIINALNQKNYYTKFGKPFGKNSIYEILKNEKYTGVFIFNKCAKVGRNGKYNRHQYNRAQDIIRVEGGIPQIISPETFKDAQTILERRRRSKAMNKAKVPYLLSGLLKCGHCGGAMVGEAHRYKDKEYFYYLCANKKRSNDCDMKSLNKLLVENAVIDEINNVLFSHQNVDAICERIYEYYNSADGSAESRINEIKKQMADTDTKIKNLYLAIERGLDFEETMKRITERKNEKDELDLKLIELTCVKQPEKKSLEELKRSFMSFANIKNLPEKQQKAVLNRFLEKIVVAENPKSFKVQLFINPDAISLSEFSDIIGCGRRIRTLTE